METAIDLQAHPFYRGFRVFCAFQSSHLKPPSFFNVSPRWRRVGEVAKAITPREFYHKRLSSVTMVRILLLLYLSLISCVFIHCPFPESFVYSAAQSEGRSAACRVYSSIVSFPDVLLPLFGFLNRKSGADSDLVAVYTGALLSRSWKRRFGPDQSPPERL